MAYLLMMLLYGGLPVLQIGVAPTAQFVFL
jgi:hypothetical protein